MKKIIITTALLLGTTIIYAQKSNGISKGKEQILSTEDPHNPLVNGIPYDQYKAQVQAEQKQKAAKEAEAKIQQKQMMEKEAQLKLSPNPNLTEKYKNSSQK